MATIKQNPDYMALPSSIKRGQNAPLDTTAVWYSKASLEEYAKNGATAYVGQVVTLIENSACEAYMIASESGTLIKLAASTASGDLASDVATLQSQVESLVAKVGTPAVEGEEPADPTGLYAEIADVLAIANGKVSGINGDNSISVTGTTEPTIGVKISAEEGNSLSLKDDGLFVEVGDLNHPEYTIVQLESATAGMAASYQLQKDGENVGAVIDIPKDMVVQSGSVETYAEGGLPEGVTEAGTYIVLTLANAASDKLYIKASDLIEYVTSGSNTGDMVVVNVDPVSHKVTASITDGTITKAKLDSDLQTAIEDANSAVQSVDSGSANGTISVDGEDVAVTGLGSAAFVSVESLNQSGADAAAQAKKDIVGSVSDNSDADTIKGAKAYADEKAAAAQSAAIAEVSSKINALDVEDTAVAKQFVTAVSQTDGKIGITRRALEADDIPELNQSKIAGLSAALDAKQDNLTFNTAYDAATNKAATMADVNDAKVAVVGTAEDGQNVDTVKGAKAYADAQATAALAEAKSYVDGITTGDTGVGPRLAAVETKLDGIDSVSESIATAKAEAVSEAGSATDKKIAAAKLDILGEKDYNKSVKDAYDLADSKATLAQVEALGYATETSVTEISTTVGNLSTAQDELEERVKANEDAIGILNGSSSVEGSVDNKVAAAINDFATKVSDDNTINTFKELIDYAAAHKGEYSTLSGSVQTNTEAIAALNGDETEVGSVAKKVKDVTDPLDERIAALEGGSGAGIDADDIQKWNDSAANAIETVKVGGTALPVTKKSVDITSISTDLLVTGSNTLILNCGGVVEETEVEE